METLDLHVDGDGVAWLRLNRPAVHNAMDAAMIAALTEAAGRLGRDPAVRVVVLTGHGASFCAGGDLGRVEAQMGRAGQRMPPPLRRCWPPSTGCPSP